MSNDDPEHFGESNFTVMVLIGLGVGHVALIALLVYVTCCRKRCVCSINLHNTTINQRNSSVTEIALPEYTPRDNTQLTDTVMTSQTNMISNETRPVSNCRTSFLTRVRSHIDRTTAPNVDSIGEPPPYSDHAGQDNIGADIDEEANLPAYQEFERYIPTWHATLEAEGTLEVDLPPPYSEVVGASDR